MRRGFRYGWLLGCIASVALAGSAVGQAPSAASARAEVRLAWEYENLPAEMSVYEAQPQRPFDLWEMRTVATFDEIPKGAPLQEGRTELEPGSRKRLVLVFHNTSDKAVYFFAAPHRMTPAAATLGFKFHCLCLDNIYRVKAGQYWYRTVELTARGDFRADQPLHIVHTLVGVDAARVQQAAGASGTRNPARP